MDEFYLVATLFGGQDALLSRVVYGLVGIGGLLCVGLLFKPSEEIDPVTDRHSSLSNPTLRTEFGEEPDFTKEQDVRLKKKNSGTNNVN